MKNFAVTKKNATNISGTMGSGGPSFTLKICQHRKQKAQYAFLTHSYKNKPMYAIPIIIVALLFVSIAKTFRASNKPSTYNQEQEVKQNPKVTLHESEDILKDRQYDWRGMIDTKN